MNNRAKLLLFSLFFSFLLTACANQVPQKEIQMKESMQKTSDANTPVPKQNSKESAKLQPKLISEMSDSELKNFFELEKSKLTKKELFELQPVENKLASLIDKKDWETAGLFLEKGLKEWLEMRADWIRILLIGKTYGNDWGVPSRLGIEALEGYIWDREDLYFAKAHERAVIIRSQSTPPYEQVELPLFGLSAKKAYKNKEKGFENLEQFLTLIENSEKSKEITSMKSAAKRQFIDEYNIAINTFDRTMQVISTDSIPCKILKNQCTDVGDCDPWEEAKQVGLC